MRIVRRQTVRKSPEALTQEALETPHAGQRAKLVAFLAEGWTVSSVKSFEGTTVVTLDQAGRIAAIYPNGLVSRAPRNKKIEWTWKFAALLVNAPVIQ